MNYFNNSTDKLPIDPYILGILIGDGSLMSGIELTTMDEEIFNTYSKFVIENNLKLHLHKNKKNSKARAWGARRITNKASNHIFDILKDLKLNVKCDYKHVPFIYKTSSVENRLQILAGILDTDGHASCGGFDFISKSKTLAEDVSFLARSLGLASYIKECKKSAHPNHIGTYYRCGISGDCTIIPTKVKRKKSLPRKMNKNVLYTGFSIENVGQDDFYGFVLDGNGRYLLDDFTITHNSGKSLMAMLAIKEAQKKDEDSQQVYIDSENTFNVQWAETLGLDTSRVIIIDGELAVNGRRCFEMLLGEPKEDAKHVLVGKKKEGLLDKIYKKELNINIIVLDSLGAVIPTGEDVASVGKANMALMARFLTPMFKKLSLEVNKANIPFLIINHKRDNMELYGQDHTFSGGNTYAHFLSANIYFEAVMRKDAMILDEKDNKVGHIIRATTEKSKFCAWPKKCEFKVNFGIGVIDRHEEIAQLSLDYEIVSKPTSVTHEYGDRKWVGFNKFCDAIKDDYELATELEEKISEARRIKLENTRTKQEIIKPQYEESSEEDVENKKKKKRG